jgi:hypothetical protein
MMMILSASESAGNGMTMLLLVLCATVIMVVLLRRHQFRSTTRREMSRDHVARIRDQHKLRHSMDELLVELEEVSRRVGAQVDTKFAKLETVIRDADERIARLEHVLGRQGGGGESPGHRATRDEPSQSGMSAVGRLPSTEPAARDISRSPEHQPSDSPTTPDESSDPRFRHVYDLIDAGATPIKAAEQLGLPLGEVELILNLRKFR